MLYSVMLAPSVQCASGHKYTYGLSLLNPPAPNPISLLQALQVLTLQEIKELKKETKTTFSRGGFTNPEIIIYLVLFTFKI